MEWLILSDLHLSAKFEQNKLNYLVELVNNYQNIIINGDLYEAKYTDPVKFINGGYKPFLDLLKEKNTIYLFGNHDPKVKAQIVADYFTDKQLLYYKVQLGDTHYHIEHGHRLSTPEKENTSDFISKLLDTVLGPVEKYVPLLVKYEGSKWNKKILETRYNDGLIKNHEILICGHTHVKIPQIVDQYLNTGATKHGKGNYIILNEDGYKFQEFTY